VSKQRAQRQGEAAASRPDRDAKQAQPAKQSHQAKQAKAAQQARQAKAVRRKQRQETRRQVKTRAVRRGHVGWAGMRRSRRQKLGIAAAAVVGIAVIWIFADWQLAIGLTALLLVALPAFVVLTMGRRY
jgi:Flp pilus assembly protein TadB